MDLPSVKACAQCEAEFPRRKRLSDKQWRGQKFCSRACRDKAAYKGLRMSGGYVQLRRPDHPLAHANGWIPEHRLVVYEAGITIPPGHVVHHKNEDRTDNRIENLEVLPIGEHTRRHFAERGFVTTRFGVFPVLTDPDERRARNTRRCVAYQRRRREQERAA